MDSPSLGSAPRSSISRTTCTLPATQAKYKGRQLALRVFAVPEHVTIRIRAVREQQLGAAQDALEVIDVQRRSAEVEQRRPILRRVAGRREPRLVRERGGHEIRLAGTAGGENVGASDSRIAVEQTARGRRVAVADGGEEALGVIHWRRGRRGADFTGPPASAARTRSRPRSRRVAKRYGSPGQKSPRLKIFFSPSRDQAPRARSRSSKRSSVASMPTASRTSPSEIPRRRRSSGSRPACVESAG